MRRRAVLAAPVLAAIPALPPGQVPQGGARIITPFGDIVVSLFIKEAPLSCQDFLRYVARGLYDQGRFFRTVRADNDHGQPPIRVLQGGIGDPARAWAPIAHEPTSRTGLRHLDGTLSLTRDAPGTGSGAEFFICIGDQPALDAGGHRNKDGQGFAAFGQVRAGMEVVRKIWSQPTGKASPDPYTAGQLLSVPVAFRVRVER
jgi:peptidyl-prolyl cis-trans isomerase A (cyclophilin A)